MRQLTTEEIEQAERNVFVSSVHQIAGELSRLICKKNKAYGNSALSPLNIFSGKAMVGQRVDDKLARIKNNATLKKNDVVDLMGYLTLICVENEWTDFSDLHE